MKIIKRVRAAIARKRRLREAVAILKSLGFGPRQSNEIAGYTLLALLDLPADRNWGKAAAPLRGITPIIDFIWKTYGVRYAPNTRETVRDEAVKYFVEAGMLLRNPDDAARPTNSGNTVYQVERTVLKFFQSFGSPLWKARLKRYLSRREIIRRALERKRDLARIPVRLPSGKTVKLSPGGQNPLIKHVIEQFCPRFVPGGVIVYIGDTENKFANLDEAYLKSLGISVPPADKMPDVVVHDERRNWLVLIEAVTSVGPVDTKRRRELRDLFKGPQVGLVFVTAFLDRGTMRMFLPSLAWETEVWIAEAPDHLIHFNGDRFLGPHAEKQ